MKTYDQKSKNILTGEESYCKLAKLSKDGGIQMQPTIETIIHAYPFRVGIVLCCWIEPPAL